MVQIFSESLREFWSKWDIRVTVMTSLVLQTVLITIGNRRKRYTGKWHNFLLWSAYLSADWIATVALSLLFGSGDSKENYGKPQHRIMAFWAPFLLLHLGGPDTITAYSLEDNELWWRHLFTLIVQVVIAFYIVLRAWTGNYVLNFLSTLIFVAGLLKFGERTWVQRCASSKYFRKDMLNPPDPGPDYARFMEEYHSKRLEGFEVSSSKMFEASKAGEHVIVTTTPASTRMEDNLCEAYSFFKVFKQLFADLILSLHDMENSRFFFKSCTCQTAFRIIEIELGFIFDVFYTKSIIIFSLTGAIIRSISFSLTLFVFLFFLRTDKKPYSRLDEGITYLLLSGAIMLETYAVVLILCSDRAMLWLSKQDNAPAAILYRAISWFSPPEHKRWSNQIAQFNLISLCFREKPVNWFCLKLQRALCISDSMETSRYKEFCEIPTRMKELIFEQLQKRAPISEASSNTARSGLGTQWGKMVLQENDCLDELGWSIVDVQFDQSILLWHIATDLCYYSEAVENYENTSPPRPDEAWYSKNNSKLLSDYMLYLLVMRPSMLPDGIGQIRFQDTRAEGDKFFKGRSSVSNAKEARIALLDVSTDIPPSEVKGDRSKSVLFHACKLAKDLQRLEAERKWEVGVCEPCVGGNAFSRREPVPEDSARSQAPARRRASHSCLASHGSSRHNRQFSDFQGSCQN